MPCSWLSYCCLNQCTEFFVCHMFSRRWFAGDIQGVGTDSAVWLIIGRGEKEWVIVGCDGVCLAARKELQFRVSHKIKEEAERMLRWFVIWVKGVSVFDFVVLSSLKLEASCKSLAFVSVLFPFSFPHWSLAQARNRGWFPGFVHGRHCALRFSSLSCREFFISFCRPWFCSWCCWNSVWLLARCSAVWRKLRIVGNRWLLRLCVDRVVFPLAQDHNLTVAMLCRGLLCRIPSSFVCNPVWVLVRFLRVQTVICFSLAYVCVLGSVFFLTSLAGAVLYRCHLFCFVACCSP